MLPLQVGQVSSLQAGQVVLQSGVGVGVTVGKLVYIIFSVKAEGKGHDIVAPVVRTTVIVHIFGWKPLPATAKRETHITLIYEERQLGLEGLRIKVASSENVNNNESTVICKRREMCGLTRKRHINYAVN